MVETGFAYTAIVMLAAVGFTYVIQFRSVISPCFVEFDDRRINELRLMAVYNKIMDSSFRSYVVLVLMSFLFYLRTGNIIFELVGLYIQIIYFAASMIVMSCMYYRSIRYWKRYA